MNYKQGASTTKSHVSHFNFIKLVRKTFKSIYIDVKHVCVRMIMIALYRTCALVIIVGIVS